MGVTSCHATNKRRSVMELLFIPLDMLVLWVVGMGWHSANWHPPHDLGGWYTHGPQEREPSHQDRRDDCQVCQRQNKERLRLHERATKIVALVMVPVLVYGLLY